MFFTSQDFTNDTLSRLSTPCVFYHIIIMCTILSCLYGSFSPVIFQLSPDTHSTQSFAQQYFIGELFSLSRAT
ncbi:hypothetical protein BDV40DRAFT_257821 [Aspergillus tamarii]|uniref:Uncharacterized protein n=1 Tax=Aspergillus tamarii TaxID=41984 RepID=A0A5N6V3L0_ASPTM|nr:hypothetical protein BDV40DRAFT_257821 [Aspergillus tamarii]